MNRSARTRAGRTEAAFTWDSGATVPAFSPCFKPLPRLHLTIPASGTCQKFCLIKDRRRSKSPTAVVLIVALAARGALECHLLLFAGI